MAKVLCSLSGVEFKVQYFRSYLSAREHHHPIFSIPSHELLLYADRYLQYKLTPIENYLYYLALFNSTGLIEFRVPAIQTQHTQSIIAQNMESLLCIVEKINLAGADKVRNVLNLPKFVISPDTKDLSNTKYWIEIWNQNYEDYKTSYKTSTLIEKISKKELILEKLIKDKTKDISSYANQLAEWAALAGDFETYANYLVLDEKDKKILMKDYWKRIIKMCASGQAIFSVPEIDLIDLIEHCEETIDHGTIFAHTLMALLRSALKQKQTFTSLGDIDLGNGTVFRILDPEASVEDANRLALIDSAPLNEPKEKDYPNKLAYLKAKTKWKMASDYRAAQELMDKKEKNSESEGNTENKNRRLTDGIKDVKNLIDKL